MIIWGNNFYTIKSFSPLDLGLIGSQYNGYEMKIIQKYFHLYWIPFVPTGIDYIIKSRTEDVSYHAPQDIKDAMKQSFKLKGVHSLPAFAFILIIAVFLTMTAIISGISDRNNKAQQKLADEEKAIFFKNKESFIPYKNKLISIKNATYVAKAKEVDHKKIDTSNFAKMAMLLLENYKFVDTTIFFSDKNTKLLDITQLDTSNYFYLSNLLGTSSSAIEWYMSNFDESKTKYMHIGEFKKTNEYLDSIKYIVFTKENGIIYPRVEGNSGFTPGYMTSDCYLYDLTKEKITKKFNVLSMNSAQMHTYGNDIQSALIADLKRNTQTEILYKLKIKERPKDKEGS